MEFMILLIATGLFLISYLQFREKGFLLNNAYLFASEQERASMDKKPLYRQSANVFCLLGAIFLMIGIESLLATGWLYYLIGAIGFLTVVYAIVSSIKETMKDSQKTNSDQ